MKSKDILRVLALASFAMAVLAILISPFTLASSYSWLSNSISESASQGTETAWIGRAALALSGIGVLLTAVKRAKVWGKVATTAFTAFGLMWLATAVFSTRSWIATEPFNELENLLHSIFASTMSIIIAGALVVAFRNTQAVASRVWALGLAAVATFFPLASVLAPDFAGVFQRLMFFFTYLWFARETLRAD